MPEVEFYGESFGLVDSPNEFALMEFAESAESVEENTLAALSSMFRLLKDSIVSEDWNRFRALARKNRAGSETLMPVIFAVFEQTTDRPTSRPADSSVGPGTTVPSSVSQPADPAMERFAGRPDMQASLLATRGHLAAVSA